jgi:Na+(H+)/acetate symporter ActP
MRQTLTTIAELLGMALVVVGLTAIDPWAGVVAVGVVLVAFGVVLGADR